ncbi:serine/threonine-protein kinase [Sorangium sp. So ce131]|uniref:serine/threonine-protein kinase n=1 Tax=Sorangium sp. So ce131 TaxID=3133282 RepID=UPI003F625ECA
MSSTLLRQAPADPSLWPDPSAPVGTVIAGRFTLEALAGRGGMGTVYRATDALGGRRVAVKLLHPSHDASSPRRFAREAELLSALRHPGIVAYVAHGRSEQGPPFLAMEWLDGEDLARRLARQPLSLAETLSLLRHAAEALAEAHARGIIHRDIKPSNLFLRDGRPEGVVLLDFGLARHALPSCVMTGSQTMLGTPGYMAPEQAAQQSELTPAADIFSLGCVLYECLAGEPPFRAPHLVAALAKILFTEPAPLQKLRPELPDVFQGLVDSMLAKEPSRRLPAARDLLEALEALRARLEAAPGASAPEDAPLPSLAGQQLATVLLAAPRVRSAEGASAPPDSRVALRDALRTLLAPQGARVELLSDGTLVAALAASFGSATDPAAVAARCALFLVERWPEASVVLATGRSSLDAHLPAGEAMDRAGQLLLQVERCPAADPAAPVLLDEVTAGLLGPGFQLARPPSGLGLHLLGEHLGADESRPLLGKPTPCVGREHELALLDMAFAACVEEPAAQAVLVTAPAGTGKSRLRHEFLRRLERHAQPPLVLLGRGDPMSAGSADGLLGRALRRLCGLSDGEPPEERRARLSRRLSQHLPPAQAQGIVEFLGELCGVPFSAEHSPPLRAARGEPRLMSTQVERALVAFLRAECARRPVLLVLEDLHWGDPLSIKLLGDARRELAEQPFMVLALARPEVKQLLPASWSQRVQQVPLRGLSRRASERMVREVLGPDVPRAVLDRLVEQAAGNALFLEELIRATAEGRGESAPETVLAMLHARLGRLEPEARRVLLAGSFYGSTFWSGGVSALLGEELSGPDLRRWLEQLAALEWIELQTTSRFPAEDEVRFRHALVRDAAYGLVPEHLKAAGHRRAADWLERRGEGDPQVLAEHCRIGEQPERAVHFYTRAAERLFDRDDMQGAERCLQAALALGPRGDALVQLRALQAATAFWRDDFATMYAVGRAVQPEMKPGGARWCKLIDGLSLGCGLSAQAEYLFSLGRLLLGTEPEPEARDAYYLSLCFMGLMNEYLGAMAEAEACLDRLDHTGQDVIARDGVVRGWRAIVYGFRSLYLTEGPWEALAWMRRAVRAFREVGAERGEVAAIAWEAQALLALGDHGGAMERVRHGMALALRVSPRFGVTFAQRNLARILAASPETAHREEAQALALGWAEGRTGNREHIGYTHLILAEIAAARGALGEAEAQAREACEVMAPFAPFLSEAREKVGALLLAQGRAAEAREVAELALRELGAVGEGGIAKVGLLVGLADACFAGGDAASGEQALQRAVQCVRSRAEAIAEDAVRERFLRQVPANARVLELSRQRLGEAAVSLVPGRGRHRER